jgi:hypothetical protein
MRTQDSDGLQTTQPPRVLAAVTVVIGVALLQPEGFVVVEGAAAASASASSLSGVCCCMKTMCGFHLEMR